MIRILIICLLLCSFVRGETPTSNYVHQAKVIKVKDGDTIRVELDIGFGLKLNDTIRFFRTYAPEFYKPKNEQERINGIKVKEFLIKKLPLGSDITIQTAKDRREKYGRLLAEGLAWR